MIVTAAETENFKAMGKATTKVVGESYVATQLSLDYHAQYVKALRLNTKAQKACDAWYAYCQEFSKGAFDKGWHNWFQAATQAISLTADAQRQLVAGRAAVIADMAAHTKLSFAPSANPEAAAPAADAQADASGRKVPHLSPKIAPQLPSLDPTAEEPVTIEDGIWDKVKAYAPFAAAGALALWIVRRVL